MMEQEYGEVLLLIKVALAVSHNMFIRPAW